MSIVVEPAATPTAVPSVALPDTVATDELALDHVTLVASITDTVTLPVAPPVYTPA
jgi:hypothetical protein